MLTWQNYLEYTNGALPAHNVDLATVPRFL